MEEGGAMTLSQLKHDRNMQFLADLYERIGTGLAVTRMAVYLLNK